MAPLSSEPTLKDLVSVMLLQDFIAETLYSLPYVMEQDGTKKKRIASGWRYELCILTYRLSSRSTP